MKIIARFITVSIPFFCLFFLSYRYFGEVELCHLNPDSVDGGGQKKFEVFHFNGQWMRGRTSGGCGNEGMRKQ